MKISFLGGACEVGASCILVHLNEKNILLDCGIRQGGSKDLFPDFRTIQELGGVDCIVISHAHMDHIGTLPIISKEYPIARIFMNTMTKDLVKVLLYDSLKIMNFKEAEIPIFAEKDVDNMLNRIFAINYQTEFEIAQDTKLTFYNAGHIAGASCIYLTSPDGSLFYSGDFSSFPQKTVEGLNLPKLRPDAAILESTYGDKLHSNRDIEENKLIETASECIENGGKLLIPAFALGRAQEVILILKKAMNNGKLKKTKVYIGGMVRDINRVYKMNPLYLRSSLGKKILRGTEPFYDDNIVAVKENKERDELLSKSEPCIIVASSGMLTGGPSQLYAEKLVSVENACIVLTGYQDEEAPGRKLLELTEEDNEDKVFELNGKSIPLKCSIKKVGLSAHGDKSEIKALADFLSPKNVFLVHGNEEIISSLAKEMNNDSLRRIFVPKCGEIVDVNIHNPRKQLKALLPFLMDMPEPPTNVEIKNLWAFVFEKYSQRFFTIEELLHIWMGSLIIDEALLTSFQELIVNSIYFENDLRRFFMFRARTNEEIQEDLSSGELKANQITEVVHNMFDIFHFKKAGLNEAEKKVILYFDFPYVVKIEHALIEEFRRKTNWQLEIYPNINNNAAEIFAKKLLSNMKIKKISFVLNEKKVVVTAQDEGMPIDKIEEAKAEFQRVTGIQLIAKNQNEKSTSPAFSDNIFYAEAAIENKSEAKIIIEQNEALSLIDNVFKYEEFSPYKKSIKQKGFMELVFISPVVGQRYTETIRSLANETGWNLSIANSINQNEILKIAQLLCDEYGIRLKKNPSFNLAELLITLKIDEASIKSDKIAKDMIKKFEYLTGCRLEW